MKIITVPLSIIFRIIVFFRNKFYDNGYFKVKEIDSAVISVGNVSTGGTGKTTFVELISNYFLELGKFVVVIVKGYLREHDDMKVVELGFDNSAQHQLNTENMGDEAFLFIENLQKRNGRCLIVVCDDKLRAAKFASAKFKPEIIIVDDGFQHRKLARNLDIVIIDGNEGHLLIPAGKLREPLKNISRADLLVINEKFGRQNIPVKMSTISGASCLYELGGFFNFKKEPAEIKEKKAIAFCGIGDPESFKDALAMNNINLLKLIEFRDHKQFSVHDISNVIAQFKSLNADVILTTQKDMLRIKNSEVVLNPDSENVFKELLFNYPLYYAKIIMQIKNNSDNLYSYLEKMSILK